MIIIIISTVIIVQCLIRYLTYYLDLLSHVLSTVELIFQVKIGLLYLGLLNDPAQHMYRLLQIGLITKPVNDAITAHSNDEVSYARLSLLFALECQLRSYKRNPYELCSFLRQVKSK